MNKLGLNHKPRRLASPAILAGIMSLVLAIGPSFSGGVARAAPLAATAPGLGAAAAFSALSLTGVTNTGNSVLSGDVGADLDAAITGFVSSTPPGPGIIGGSRVFAPAVDQAQADASTADLALTAQAGSAIPAGPDLTGANLVPGVYSVGSALLTGVLTLNGPGVYIFLVDSDLTASGSVNLINGASPCNVFWHVTTLAAITGGSFVGTIIAGTSVTFGNGASLDGRAIALTGNVTLINNAIFGPNCAVPGEGQASHVSVSSFCVDDGRVAVTVGLSAGVIVTGLGAPITVSEDTGENRIVRLLPPGRYEWLATPPAGHYMLDTDRGVIDLALCGSAAIGAAAAQTPAAGGGTAAVLIPATGADLAGVRGLATRQGIRLGLGALGLALVAVGFTLRRKQSR